MKIKHILTMSVLIPALLSAAPNESMDQQVKLLEQKLQSVQSQIDTLKQKEAKEMADRKNHKKLGKLFSKVSVITSPVLGERSEFDGSDLMTNIPSFNQDLRILQQRQQLSAKVRDITNFPNQPFIELSGQLEGQATAYQNYQTPTDSNMDLSTAKLNILASGSPWITGFTSIQYNDDPGANNNGVNTNSSLVIDKGFITVGNLKQSPFYATMGQTQVPFGEYRSFLVTNPTTNLLGKVKERMLLLGYAKNGLSSQLYGFKGQSYSGNSRNFNNWGVSANDSLKLGPGQLGFGMGYLRNLADSALMQNTGLSTFGGFDKDNHEKLQHRVAGGDLYAHYDVGSWSYGAEYTGALKRFATQDMTFNNHGAKPQAWRFELDHQVKWLANKPSTLMFGYDRTSNALALGLPRHSLETVFSTSWWKDTVQSIEFRHDIDYSKSNTATGAADTVSAAGGSRNWVTLTFDMFF